MLLFSVVSSLGVTAYAVEPIDQSADVIEPFAVIPDDYLLDGWIWNESCTSRMTYDLGDIWASPDNGVYWVVWQIELAEPISKGETFDLDAYLWMTQANPWQEWQFYAIDSAWTTLIHWNSTNSNHATHMSRVQKSYTASTSTFQYSYKVTDISANGTVKYIWILQKVNGIKSKELAHTFNDVSVTVQSSSGKLSNILEYIKNLPTNIKNALKSLFDGITSAIGNAVTALIDGIKSLFVPSESDITDYRDKWDSLLQQRFGAIYQCVSLVQDYWKSLSPGSSQGSITFPQVNLNFSGVPWSFGGFKVQLIPAGFATVVSVLRLIVNAVCTLSFLNAMKNKYERLMDG